MAKLSWDAVGSRLFEIGVDRGVLYPMVGDGVAWNGLVAVSEAPEGGEPKPYYIDGEKFQNIPSVDEFAGTIEAYTYPEAFEKCDGTAHPYAGLGVHNQRREPFGFSYRTRIGNDVDGDMFAYKIHIVYNALVVPSQKSFKTTGADPEAMNFSWNFTTTPVSAGTPYLASSHFTVESNRVSSSILAMVEDILYGTDSLAPSLPTPAELYDIFDPSEFSETYEVILEPVSGLHELSYETGADVAETVVDGIFELPAGTRLVESVVDGIYTLEI